MDAVKEIDNIVEWIQDWFSDKRPETKAIIGISGGKDSTIVAALLVKALGPERVLGIMMPNGVQADIGDSHRVIELLGIPSKTINIKRSYDAEIEELQDAKVNINDNVRINLPPRIRMTKLYAVAAGEDGFVINTCNASEEYVGYSTKFGDNTGDMSPCMNYTVTEMLQLGDALGLPYDLVHKAPADGLCGKTDEDNLGFTYAVLDRYLMEGVCDDPEVLKLIERKHRLNLHKVEPIPRYMRK